MLFVVGVPGMFYFLVVVVAEIFEISKFKFQTAACMCTLDVLERTRKKKKKEPEEPTKKKSSDFYSQNEAYLKK